MEEQIFKGEHLAQKDGKKRIGIPVAWRPLLQGDERAVFHAYPNIKRPGHAQDALRCISSERLSLLKQQVSALPTFDKNRVVVEGLIISRIKTYNLDGQGRVILDSDQLTEVGIGDEMMVVGFGDHFQIWEPAALENHRQHLEKSVLAGEHPGLESLHL